VDRLAVAYGDGHADGGTVDAERGDGGFGGSAWYPVPGTWGKRLLFSATLMVSRISFFFMERVGPFVFALVLDHRRNEALHAETFGMMRVEEFGAADFVGADHAGDAGEREFEFFRLGCGRLEEASLGSARASGFGGKMNFHDRGSRGMGFEIELEKFEERFGVEHGDGEAEVAGEMAGVVVRGGVCRSLPWACRRSIVGIWRGCESVFKGGRIFWRDVFDKVEAGIEFEGEAQFLRGEGTGSEARAELLEHVREQEGEWFEQHERVLEFDGFFENQWKIDGD